MPDEQTQGASSKQLDSVYVLAIPCMLLTPTTAALAPRRLRPVQLAAGIVISRPQARAALRLQLRTGDALLPCFARLPLGLAGLHAVTKRRRPVTVALTAAAGGCAAARPFGVGPRAAAAVGGQRQLVEMLPLILVDPVVSTARPTAGPGRVRLGLCAAIGSVLVAESWRLAGSAAFGSGACAPSADASPPRGVCALRTRRRAGRRRRRAQRGVGGRCHALQHAGLQPRRLAAQQSACVALELRVVCAPAGRCMGRVGWGYGGARTPSRNGRRHGFVRAAAAGASTPPRLHATSIRSAQGQARCWPQCANPRHLAIAAMAAAMDGRLPATRACARLSR